MRASAPGAAGRRRPGESGAYDCGNGAENTVPAGGCASGEARFLRGLMATAGAPAEAVARADFLATRPGWRAPTPQRRVSWLTRIACYYAQCCNFAIFPMHRDKRPLVKGGFLAATRDCEQTAAWFERWPDALIAAATGAMSGIVVLDLDAKGGKDGLASLRAAGITLPRSWLARSPSGGCHLYFVRPAEAVPSRANVKMYGRELAGVDVRGDGGAIILPTPRTRYRWTARRPGRCDLAPFPRALLDGLRWRAPERPAPVYQLRPAGGAHWQRVLDDCCRAIATAAPGGRQEMLSARAWQAGKLAGEGKLEPAAALQAVLAAAAAITGPDWDRAEALATARRRFEAGAAGNG